MTPEYDPQTLPQEAEAPPKKAAAKKVAAKKAAPKKAAAKKKAAPKKKAAKPALEETMPLALETAQPVPAAQVQVPREVVHDEWRPSESHAVPANLESPAKPAVESRLPQEHEAPEQKQDISEEHETAEEGHPFEEPYMEDEPLEDENHHGSPNGDSHHERPRREIVLGPPQDTEGMVELSPKGFGFLRQANRSFYQTNKDTFIPPDMVRNYQLRDGLILTGEMRRGPRGPQLTAIYKINGCDPAKYRDLPVFEELTAINPNKRWILETDPKRYTTRIIDMMTPIGRGQRGLIVAPPRTGKTTLLQHIAEAVIQNGRDAKLIMLLIDERPEEVTELTRALPKAEIMASSNDNDTRTHMRIAEMAIERAKRLVEAGEHVFILLDSITRLARAYNRAMRGKGGLNKGGLSNRALEIPRKLFAAARNTREAGSLTIVATALIDTGTAMDEAIYQEFKGTGNLELVLDKRISQQYIYPAVDIFKSGTRREELLLPAHQIEKIYIIRRGLSGHKPVEAIERLLSFVERFPNNAQLLLEIKGGGVNAD